MPNLSFDIKNANDLFNKLLDDYDDFKKDKTSTRIALNCAMTAWHLNEWIAYDENPNASNKDVRDFQFCSKEKCPSLQIMHDVTTGTKHHTLTHHKPLVTETDLHKGDFSNDFSRDFDITMLTIEMKDGSKLYFEDELMKVINFYKDYFNEHNNHRK